MILQYNPNAPEMERFRVADRVLPGYQMLSVGNQELIDACNGLLEDIWDETKEFVRHGNVGRHNANKFAEAVGTYAVRRFVERNKNKILFITG